MKIQLKRSSVLDGGSAKQPLADQLEYGELAVNYAAADPTIFIKNSTNEVIAIAGANALSSVPTLDSVTKEGNWSSADLLVGGSPSDPNLQLNNTGNVITSGYFRAEKATTTDASYEVFLNDVQTFKVLGTGTIALGGTIDTTLDQSQANLVLNAESGKVTAISAETSGTIISGGKLTVSAGGADLTGTVNINNSLNVTEGTALTGAVTMESTLGVTGVATLTSLNAAYYDLNALAALPE